LGSKNPLVSIICHCYNHSKFVTATLNSILNQSYNNIEIILVDDFSTDNSVNVISDFIIKHPEIKFIQNHFNLGITKSFNKTLKTAKGKYIIDLSADDLLLPNCVTKQVSRFQTSIYKNLAIVYGNAELISEDGIFLNYFFDVDSFKNVTKERPTGKIYETLITSGKTFCSVSGMVKKEVYDTLNGYDESLEYEDYDFWIRASRNYEIDFIDEVLIQKRVVTNSLETFFFKKNNTRSERINYSTFLILKNILKMNRTKKEDLAVQKRIHYEIIHCLRNRHYSLFFKNLNLRLQLSWRKKFKKYA
jgi:glycosyltransferase involved in cell wall biosynthesis